MMLARVHTQLANSRPFTAKADVVEATRIMLRVKQPEELLERSVVQANRDEQALARPGLEILHKAVAAPKYYITVLESPSEIAAAAAAASESKPESTASTTTVTTSSFSSSSSSSSVPVNCAPTATTSTPPETKLKWQLQQKDGCIMWVHLQASICTEWEQSSMVLTPGTNMGAKVMTPSMAPAAAGTTPVSVAAAVSTAGSPSSSSLMSFRRSTVTADRSISASTAGVSSILQALAGSDNQPPSQKRPKTIHRCILQRVSRSRPGALRLSCHVCTAAYATYSEYYDHLIDSTCKKRKDFMDQMTAVAAANSANQEHILMQQELAAQQQRLEQLRHQQQSLLPRRGRPPIKGVGVAAPSRAGPQHHELHDQVLVARQRRSDESSEWLLRRSGSVGSIVPGEDDVRIEGEYIRVSPDTARAELVMRKRKAAGESTGAAADTEVAKIVKISGRASEIDSGDGVMNNNNILSKTMSWPSSAPAGSSSSSSRFAFSSLLKQSIASTRVQMLEAPPEPRNIGFDEDELAPLNLSKKMDIAEKIQDIWGKMANASKKSAEETNEPTAVTSPATTTTTSSYSREKTSEALSLLTGSITEASATDADGGPTLLHLGKKSCEPRCVHSEAMAMPAISLVEHSMDQAKLATLKVHLTNLLVTLLGENRLTEMGYPDTDVLDLLGAFLQEAGCSLASASSASEACGDACAALTAALPPKQVRFLLFRRQMEAARANVQKLLEICVQERAIWTKRAWTGKSVEEILEDIAAKGIKNIGA